MNRRNKILSVIGVPISLMFLTSCASSGSAITSSEVYNIQPLTLDEVVSTRVLSQTPEEKAAEFRTLIEDKKVVDSQNLMNVTDRDAEVIRSTFNKINSYLTGVPGSESVISDGIFSDNYANYLLLEFAHTGQEWVQDNMQIVGYDPKTRLFFVDVSYKTTNVTKNVVPSSKIPLGHKDSTELLSKRYTEYMAIAKTEYQLKQSGTTDPTQFPEAAQLYNVTIPKFENNWGTIESIMREQQEIPLITRTRELDHTSGGLGKLTYGGLIIDNKVADLPATMTVRYVLKYRLNLGEETDLYVTSAYLKGYEVEGALDVLENYKLEDIGSVGVLRPFIDRLITSYSKAVEESNMMGLYDLHRTFSNWDKYYDELNDYTYQSFDGFSFDILSKTGSEVIVKVTQGNKYRAKGMVGEGTESSIPQYITTNIFTLSLGSDDRIYITSVIPIKKELVGEPESIIRNITGISETIEYSNTAFSQENKEKTEALLQDFFEIVTNNDITSEKFLSTIELGISRISLNRITETIQSIQANKHVAYIINWENRTNSFASVRVKELFERQDSNYETEATIEMVNRGGQWKVVNYTRDLSIRLEPRPLDGGVNGTIQAFAINERNEQVDTTGNVYERTEFDDRVDETEDMTTPGDSDFWSDENTETQPVDPTQEQPIDPTNQEPIYQDPTVENPTQEVPQDTFWGDTPVQDTTNQEPVEDTFWDDDAGIAVEWDN